MSELTIDRLIREHKQQRKRIAELEDELEFVLEANRIGRSNVMKIRGLQSQIAAKDEALESVMSDGCVMMTLQNNNPELIQQIQSVLTTDDAAKQEAVV